MRPPLGHLRGLVDLDRHRTDTEATPTNNRGRHHATLPDILYTVQSTTSSHPHTTARGRILAPPLAEASQTGSTVQLRVLCPRGSRDTALEHCDGRTARRGAGAGRTAGLFVRSRACLHWHNSHALKAQEAWTLHSSDCHLFQV